VIDEVEHVIEPATRIVGRPKVQLGLHPPYPRPRLIRPWPRLTGIHQRLLSLQNLTCMNPLGPFAMYAAFPRSDYYEPSAPPEALGRRRAFPPPPAWTAGRGRKPGVVPTFTMNRSTKEVSRFAPAAHATATPQTFTVASQPASLIRPRSCPPHPGRARTATQPVSSGFELVHLLRGFRTLVPRVHLSVSLDGPAPSGSIDASRRCRGCLPSSPSSPGSDCPQLRYAAATASRCRHFTSTRLHGASWRSGK
jgi:hypothetical protein